MSIGFGTIALLATAMSEPPGGSIPFQVRELFGRRPVVTASVNGHPLDMMVHSSADFTMQINHAGAREAGVTDLVHRGAYGIEAVGKVSALGRDEGRVARLVVGAVEDRDIPVSVFELPTPARVGMLGLGWITAHGIVMDFAAGTILADQTPRQRSDLRRRLSKSGYVAVPMRLDPASKRYLVDVRIGRTTRPMIVNTVTETVLDRGFAAAAGVPEGPSIGNYGGPKGRVGKVYKLGMPVRLTLGKGVSLDAPDAHIHDVYDYAGEVRPSDPSRLRGGAIGPDVLIAAGTVIDFGGRTVFVRQAASSIRPSDRHPSRP